MTGLIFKHLSVRGWRQFGHVEIELHPRLTILTGANGAGKSSLLKIFSRHFGFDRPFLGTPIRQSDGGYSYYTGLFTHAVASFWRGIWNKNPSDTSDVGFIRYSNEVTGVLRIPAQAGVTYHVGIDNQQSIAGIHIDSHAPMSHFQQVNQIPTNVIRPANAYANYNNEVQNKYNGGHTGFSPTYRMKEAIIAMAMFGEGNSQVEGNKEILQAYRGFVETLGRILPESLGFRDIAVRPPEVVLVTDSGEFLIDAASGGIMTVIDLTWRLYLFSLSNQQFVVTFDEPENHLHPTMQRSLLPKLVKAFPDAQFIVATHSPFMVSALKDSYVYVLRYRDTLTGQISKGDQILPTDKTRVMSMKLDITNKGGTASEILREVLGVDATIPEWVEDDLTQVIERYRDREISVDLLNSLRKDLRALGYDELYPDALAKLASYHD